MKEKSYVRVIGVSKLIQLIVTGCIDIAFFLVLFLNTEFRNNIFSNSALAFLCISIWVALLCFLIFIFVDIHFIRNLSIETYELNKRAFFDHLTSIPNRQSLDLLFETHNTPDSIANMGCGMICISNLNAINEQLGREVGDTLLQDFCKLTDQIKDSYDFVGRNSGNEFIFVIEDCTQENYDLFLNKLQAQLKDYNEHHAPCPIEVHIAFTMNRMEHLTKLNQLFASTSEKLHSDQTIAASDE